MPAWKTEWTVTKRKMKLARDDVRGGLPVLPALNLLTLYYCYCVVLYYLLLIVLRFIVVCKRCGVLFGIEYFLKFWYFSLMYSVWHSAVFVYTAWLSVYDRLQDGRRITEGGTTSQNLPSSSLPGSFIVLPPTYRASLRRSNGRQILRSRKEFSFDSNLMLGCGSFVYWASWPKGRWLSAK
jgi:hypothetical protein